MTTSAADILPPPAGPARQAPSGARLVRPRRSLPGGRAVVGAFLVTLAAVGTFVAYVQATSQPTTLYVVARHNLNLGDRLAASDLALAPMRLPAEMAARRAFTKAAAPGLVGATVVAPMATGELIQASALMAGGPAGDRQLSFAIDPARAVGGHLVSGESVDVLATFGTGAEATTSVVVRGARVVSRIDSGGSLGAKASEVIVLELTSASDTLAVTHAVDSGQLTLVRSGAAPAGRVGSPSGGPPSGTG